MHYATKEIEALTPVMRAFVTVGLTAAGETLEVRLSMSRRWDNAVDVPFAIRFHTTVRAEREAVFRNRTRKLASDYL